ncbi:hypothetical protein TKK_0015868 [Trichogramma kaykai]|uniref:SH2 domain-containing protein n=1 Tax=Trichogramma kaykai TaxID=54128 RepID=A0ABD2W9G4_9HYME
MMKEFEDTQADNGSNISLFFTCSRCSQVVNVHACICSAEYNYDFYDSDEVASSIYGSDCGYSDNTSLDEYMSTTSQEPNITRLSCEVSVDPPTTKISSQTKILSGGGIILFNDCPPTTSFDGDPEAGMHLVNVQRVHIKTFSSGGDCLVKQKPVEEQPLISGKDLESLCRMIQLPPTFITTIPCTVDDENSTETSYCGTTSAIFITPETCVSSETSKVAEVSEVSEISKDSSSPDKINMCTENHNCCSKENNSNNENNSNICGRSHCNVNCCDHSICHKVISSILACRNINACCWCSKGYQSNDMNDNGNSNKCVYAKRTIPFCHFFGGGIINFDEFTIAMHWISPPGDSEMRILTEPEIARLKDIKKTLLASGWYYENFTWSQADVLLKNAPIGRWLLRDSSDKRFTFSLSIKTTSGHIAVRISYVNGCFSFDTILHPGWNKVPIFPCPIRMIEHYIAYSKNPTGRYQSVWVGYYGEMHSKMCLEEPILKSVRSLSHLSRISVFKNRKILSSQIQKLPQRIKAYIEEYPYTM